MIEHRRDNSILLTDDRDPSRAQLIPASASEADRDAAILAFFGPPPPPESVSMVQARIVLTQTGLIDQINVAVASADAATKVAWEYATELHRTSPTLAAVAAAVGLTEAQVDDLFRAAATINV